MDPSDQDSFLTALISARFSTFYSTLLNVLFCDGHGGLSYGYGFERSYFLFDGGGVKVGEPEDVVKDPRKMSLLQFSEQGLVPDRFAHQITRALGLQHTQGQDTQRSAGNFFETEPGQFDQTKYELRNELRPHGFLADWQTEQSSKPGRDGPLSPILSQHDRDNDRQDVSLRRLTKDAVPDSYQVSQQSQSEPAVLLSLVFKEKINKSIALALTHVAQLYAIQKIALGDAKTVVDIGAGLKGQTRPIHTCD